MTPTDVLIVGAGPTGLVLALALTQLGIKIRIVDKEKSTAETSRAIIIHSRTLEFYQLLDIREGILEQGHMLEALNLRTEGDQKVRIPFHDVGTELTRYPYVFIQPQHIHEPILESKLNSMGVYVERSVEFLDYADHETYITARVCPVGKRDKAQPIDASYLIGCDGAHSTVRHTVHLNFIGSPYRQTFFVADLKGTGPCIDGEAHFNFGGGENIIMVISYEEFPGDIRVHVLGAMENMPPNAEFEDVKSLLETEMQLTADEVNWFTTYRVHHRVAERFRFGRVFIAGDAAHILSPVDGQGMNTGISDSVNLAWKLAAVIKGKADDYLLNSYEVERKQYAENLIDTSDRIFTVIMEKGFVTATVHEVMFNLMQPQGSYSALGSFFFRTLSQIGRNYYDSPLSQGDGPGEIKAGDRKP
jgi:2-polyprenyl-6-methoxyphenol hydroxylase-like FAD-dependent oxidoreductase